MNEIENLARELAAAGSEEARSGLIEAFWAGAGARTPVCVPDGENQHRVTFLWRDADATAVLVGINRVTSTLEEAMMTRVAGTDIWHRTVVLGADWCGSYTLLPLDAAGLADVAAREPRWAMRVVRERGELDPRNPHTTHTHGGQASLAALPEAPGEPWLAATEPELGLTPDLNAEPAATVDPERGIVGGMDRTVSMTDRGRRVWVHGPSAPVAGERYPVIVVLDGEVWQRSGYAVRSVNALVAAGRIREPYLLLVECGDEQDRMTDLSYDGGMCDEIVSSILPWARKQLPISADPADVMVTGESLGGLTALQAAFTRPQHVGLALGQSSSLWQNDLHAAAQAATQPVRVFMAAGSLEPTIVEPNRELAQLLTESPHDHAYVEINGGHDMAWWRGQWGVGVEYLLARHNQPFSRCSTKPA